MGPSIALISSAPITRAELADFLVRNGGVVEEEGDLVGLILQDTRQLWISLSPADLRSLLEDEEREERLELPGLLGGAPVSYVGVDLDKSKGAGAMALAFAIRFTHQWPSVVSYDGELFTVADLAEVEQGRRPSYVFSR